jgi:glycosyltransferase involved in cell wall biosynthesis
MRRVLVGISLLTLVPGVVGGSEVYVRELVRALARVGEHDYRVFLPTIAADAADGLPSRVVREYPAARTMPGRILAMGAAAAVPGRVRRRLDLDELDAIHFPLSVMLPPVDRPTAVSTVLDVQHEVYPEFFSRAELAYRRAVYGWTVRRSRFVITISEHARRALIERLHLEPDRVRAIHLAVDHARFTPDGRPREPFLFYPANRWRHKNHDRLFRAFALARRERPELRLVLTGTGHHGRPVPEGVDVRGRVSLDELVGLYRSAAALVFPSLYEGFGMPAVEAMACACPVAVSRVASLPEICGDAAVYFDPTSPEDIARGILEVLERPPDGGVERAAGFTWDACARAHDAVYRELSS